MLSFSEVKIMSIATEILSLRRDRSSSVSLLLGAVEWAHSANGVNAIGREFDAAKAADLVLLTTAVHAAAADALNELRRHRNSGAQFYQPGVGHAARIRADC